MTNTEPGEPRRNWRNDLGEFERVTAWPMLGLAVIALIGLLLEISVPARERELEWFNWAISIAFALEYAWSMKLAKPGARFDFIRTHVLDLLAIIPVLQPLRIFRSLRILKLFRIGRGAVLFGKSAQGVRSVGVEDIPWLLLVTGALVGVASILAWGYEREALGASITTWQDALWWGLTTTTTVGSPLEPVTLGGRIIGLVLMLLGISVVAAMAGIFAKRFVRDEVERSRPSERETSD